MRYLFKRFSLWFHRDKIKASIWLTVIFSHLYLLIWMTSSPLSNPLKPKKHLVVKTLPAPIHKTTAPEKKRTSSSQKAASKEKENAPKKTPPKPKTPPPTKKETAQKPVK